jgi:hypothetical protein
LARKRPLAIETAFSGIVACAREPVNKKGTNWHAVPWFGRLFGMRRLFAAFLARKAVKSAALQRRNT